jgi:hypothetical protein
VDEAPKRLQFEAGTLNVISGVSRTGKSAIIPVIDYCLASGTCTIPVNTIRDACAWFGVIVRTDAGERLLARREPGGQRASGDMFTMEGAAIEPPQAIPGKNTTVDAVRRSLDELAGLTSLDFDPEGLGTGFRARPSFRDMMAFTFQPQNVVANQNILLYKADTHEHREKLRTIFPYVLGALTAETLAKKHELSQLRRELDRKERDLTSLQQVTDRWMAEVRAWVSRARELGFIKESPSAEAPPAELLDVLRNLLRERRPQPRMTDESLGASARELAELQQEESEVTTRLVQVRSRLDEMEKLRDTAKRYEGQLSVQRDRLRVSEWLESLHANGKACPICGSQMAGAHDQLSHLLGALKEIERSVGQYRSVPAAFDREYQRIQTELRSSTEKLAGIRHRTEALSRSSDEVRQLREVANNSARFLGQLEQAFGQYDQVQVGDLAGEVAILRERIRALEGEVREGEVERRTANALRRIGTFAQRVMPRLDAERPDDPLSFSVSDLTVKVTGRGSREDYLWEIGSASNWLSYHIAIALAFQEFFLSQAQSPVPSLLVFDQPSQAYFPQLLLARSQEGNGGGPEVPWRDEDVEAVRKVFQVFADAVKTAAGRLQLIVLDHATDTVWGNVKPLHLVANWRGGEKFVPPSWLS